MPTRAGELGGAWRAARIVTAAAFFLAAASLSLAGPKKHPAKPVDLNTATLAQLEELSGVGPVTAKDILEFRRKSGPFRSVNDLLAVRRITKARLEKMRPYVTVGPAKKKPAS